jgi:hypothetical protein
MSKFNPMDESSQYSKYRTKAFTKIEGGHLVTSGLTEGVILSFHKDEYGVPTINYVDRRKEQFSPFYKTVGGRYYQEDPRNMIQDIKENFKERFPEIISHDSKLR